MNILFICNGNVARSQEAELFFNSSKLAGTMHATSAGINVRIGKPIDPIVIQVMAEAGHTLEGAKRKFADKRRVDAADLIVSFVPKDKLPAHIQSHQKIRFWQVDDPRHQSLEFHRRARDQIKEQVDTLTNELH